MPIKTVPTKTVPTTTGPASSLPASPVPAGAVPASAGPASPVRPGAAEASSLKAARRRSAALDAAIRENPGRFRVLTGDRPTGPLHVGHLFGTLLNRVRLQDLGVGVMVLIADYQTLTDRDATETLPDDVLGQVADYLAVGIDPGRAAIFAHSQIAPLNQLLIPFLSLVSVAEVGRNPTVKEEFGGGRRFVHECADVHLPGPSGGRHPVLPRQPGPGRQGPASPPGTDPDDRVAL